ncbi:MAG: DUF1036 domain-containing protein [Xanthobacteraceae bacterium]|nr:DUF1036 domain-containing protein [Xanthobacteraceae bacterium]
MRSLRVISSTSLALAALLFASGGVFADFRICNRTDARVGVALGYKDGEHWTTEGWWNIPPGTCETLVRGTLIARYYYLYAQDYDQGGEWSGKAFLCTRDKEFTIQGIADCLARGYNRTGFFEVDTLDQKNWTVQLTEQNQTPQGLRGPNVPTGPNLAPNQKKK